MNRIRTKILGSFAIIVVLMAGIAIASFNSTHTLSENVQNITEYDMKMLESANEMSFSVANRAKIARDYILFSEEEFKEKFLLETKIADKLEQQIRSSLAGSRASKELKESFTDAFKKTKKWQDLVQNEIIPLYDRGDTEEAVRIMEERCIPYSQDAIDAWVNTVDIQNGTTFSQTDQITELAMNFQYKILGAALLGIIGTIVIAIIQSAKITQPITSVVSRLEDIASGDLTGKPLAVQSNDEIGRLLQAINKTSANLRILLKKVSAATDEVASSSRLFNASAAENAETAMLAALSLKEIAADADSSAIGAGEAVTAVTQLSSEVHLVAETSADISEESQKAAELVLYGNNLVDNTIKQMNLIEETVGNGADIVISLGERSNEIGQIINVMSAISEQTNLLALNAAIEAARTAEQGKGFAVVADEVRRLAVQSKQSAMQISDLINGIQEDTQKAVLSMTQGKLEVENGRHIMNDTEKVFTEISKLIRVVSKRMTEVSSSAEEMAASAEEVNSTIESLANVAENTSRNTTSVAASSDQQLAAMHEIISSAAALNRLAEDLNKELINFKL